MLALNAGIGFLTLELLLVVGQDMLTGAWQRIWRPVSAVLVSFVVLFSIHSERLFILIFVLLALCLLYIVREMIKTARKVDKAKKWYVSAGEGIVFFVGFIFTVGISGWVLLLLGYPNDPKFFPRV